MRWRPDPRRAPSALEVPGYAPAAFVPAEGDAPRPLVIGLHGNFDRPEWMCAAWARFIHGRAAGRAERIPAAHHDLQTMAPAIQRTFDWLVADDPRFGAHAD